MSEKQITNNDVYGSFKKKIIYYGRITLLLCVVLELLPGLYLAIAHGITPNFSKIISIEGSIAAAWFVLWLVEPISYFPLMGISGTFVSWLSGNIVNLRVPCSMVSQQVAGVKEGTPEGDIVSTLGLCASVIVNIIVIIIFAIAGTQILQIMPPSLKTSFSFVLPALMGGMLATYAFKNYKVCLIGVIIALVVYSIGVPSGVDLLLIIFPTLFVSVLLHKRGLV